MDSILRDEVRVSFIEKLLCWLGLLPSPERWSRTEPLRFHLDAASDQLLQILADAEQRSAEDVAADLLRGALEDRRLAEHNMARWDTLSPREQQVAALICLNYTSRQIAARLRISPETVKTHTRNLLVKFNLRTRVELRELLGDWDFNAWK
jgi:DNA-binding CsgD family transcriptional regulator